MKFNERVKNKDEDSLDLIHQMVIQRCSENFSHPEFKKLLESSPKETLLNIGSRKSSLPQDTNPLGKTTRVTLLGDAMHPMTTQGGLGANTAFEDAYHLSQSFLNDDWYRGLVKYENSLHKRGNKAVSFSLSNTKEIHYRGWKAKIGLWRLWAVGRIITYRKIILLLVLFIIFYYLSSFII